MTQLIFRFNLSVILLFTVISVSAQTYPESALLFGRTRPAGSARVLGFGGAQTAIGGDYSAGQSNPAGLGLYNRSEFTFSLGYTDNLTSSLHNGNETNSSRGVFNIPGLSYTHHMPYENDGKGFLGGSLSISMTRTNDFNRSVKYSAGNTDNSIVDYFVYDADGFPTEQFDDPHDPAFNPGSVNKYNDPTGLAYFNYLIGPLSLIDPSYPDDLYFTDAGYPTLQQQEIITKGASNQWNFSYGANFSDKYFIGAAVGITSLRYKTQKTYAEIFDNPDTIQNLVLNENLDIRGTGLNATFGAIVRPVDFLQIGLSYRTPTIYGMTENYRATMSTRWSDFDYYGDGSEILGDNTNDPIATDLVISEYNLRIPSKLSAGVAFISKFGFITADLDLTNPSKAKYKSTIDDVSFSNENSEIKAIYDRTINYRVGAEYRAGIFRFRAGYGVAANSFTNGLVLTDDEYNDVTETFRTVEVNDKIQTISAGVGIRKKSFYVDVALMRSTSTTHTQPYSFGVGDNVIGPVVKQDNRQINGVATVGFTF